MQPMKRERVNLVSVVQQAAVDFINLDPDGKYLISWDTDEDMEVCRIDGDKELLLRAVHNVITNSQVHNPDGCRISVRVSKDTKGAHIVIEDNGVGVTGEQLEQLKHTPHYSMSDGSTREPRHGLGLLIVRQIAAVHGGTVEFGEGSSGGFAVDMCFRMAQ